MPRSCSPAVRRCLIRRGSRVSLRRPILLLEVASVPGGDSHEIAILDTSSGLSPITQGQRKGLQGIVDRARTISGFAFALYVGSLEGGRSGALAVHSELRNPASTVLVAVDPAQRLIEIVTGVNVAVDLNDRACELAAMSMSSSFVAGDLSGGLREGIIMLAEHARHPRTLHLDDPA